MNRTRTSKKAKRLLVWLLMLTMVFSLLPMAAFADEAVAEPVVEEPVQDEQPSAEPTTPAEPSEEPEEPTQEPTEDPADAEEPTEEEPTDEEPVDEEEDDNKVVLEDRWLYPESTGIAEYANLGFMKIMFLDCGRKYYSVDSIKQIIDNASAAGFNYIQLAVGNDGLRFLLDDMSLTVNGKTYDSAAVTAAIHTGNEAYYNFDTDELTQSQMDTIIAYANGKGMGVIPCVNTPGHMDAILAAASSLTGTDCSYNQSVRTIDVTNKTAVAFTQALLQKYISYFAGKGCKYFNMGADEYANDVYGTGSMGFGQLQSDNEYSYYITYVNQVADLIEKAGMTPMAFNDGIYFNRVTSSGTFTTDIVICYWSSGWSGYTPMPASTLSSMGFKLINTHGDYYWVLGKENAQCNATKASEFNYKNFPGSTIENPAGAMFCIWADYPNAETEANVISKTAATIEAFGATLPKTETGGNESGGETGGETGNEVEVSLTIGGTYTVESKGKDATGTLVKSELNETIATASAEYTSTPGESTKKLGDVISIANSDSALTNVGVISDGTNYMVVDDNGIISNTTVLSEATEFTVVKNGTSYTIFGNGKYLCWTWNNGLYTDSKSDGFKYNTNKSFYGTLEYGLGSVNFYLVYNNGWTTSRTGDNYGKLHSIKTETTTSVEKTILTITGKSAGTTYCVFDGVKYKITVTDKAPDNALTDTTLTLEHWITNAKVTATNSKNDTTNTTSISATGNALTEDGVAVSDYARNPNGYWGDTAVYYWQAMRLDEANRQTDEGGDDETADGTPLTHVRYYGGAWQYKTADGIWHYFDSTDQLVAYYLQKLTVTKEIDTFTKDYGYEPKNYSDTIENGGDKKGSVALTVAVVYPDGSVSPAESSMYANSTMIFNFWDGRDIGIVAPTNNSDYNISKITVTDGKRVRADSTYYSDDKWYGASASEPDEIKWNKVTRADGSEWYDETVAWDKVTNAGTTPMVNGALGDKIAWKAKNYAKLVLIYLEPVEKETNLNVVWYDDNAKTEIGRMQIAMTYTTGAEEPKYDTALMNGSGNCIGGKKLWSSNDRDSADYLPDDAYVTNSSNVKQPINKSLSGIQNVSGIYTSGLYQYISADISEDGKTLTLHYNLSADSGKVYVVDFGLPVVIPVSAFGVEDFKTVNTISFSGTDTKEVERDGSYGHGSINTTTGDVTYTLQKPLDTKIPIPVYFTFAGNAQVVVRNVYVMPASNVYYEDSFVTFNSGKYGENETIDWTTVYETNKSTEKEATQQLSELGSKDVYGFDEAYKDSTEFSMGSARKVTVTSDMANATAWPTATFTFKGTGFDIISLTDNTSGSIFIDVYDAAGTLKKSTVVNNYFGYEKTDDGWVINKDHNGTNPLYQIPVMKVSGLDYGEYKVVITVFYTDEAVFNSTGDTKCSFWLDAVRIYNPMGEDVKDYTKDKEGYPQYIKLRPEIIDKAAIVKGTSGALFVDGAENADLTVYKNVGPNNEVYLANGQAITFKLPANEHIASIQIGAKSPNATKEISAVMNINGNETAIATATEMYYKFSESKAEQLVTITNKGDAILSLTNIKITYDAESTISLAALTDSDAEEAVAVVRALFAVPVDPEPTPEPEAFDPDRFECEWSKNVRKGGRAILTVKASTDVEYILIDGVKYDKYVTRTERTGRGWNAQRVTYREFVYMITADEVGAFNYDVVAVNGEGVQSAAETAVLTVKASSPIRDWIGGLFGRWF